MPVKWINTQFPCVRYYEHSSRKLRNGTIDKYFTIRYMVNGARKEEKLGWASEGWSAEKAHKILSDIKAGIRTGEGPQSLADKRALAHDKRETDKQAAKLDDVANIKLEAFFRNFYMPRAKLEKRSWLTDEQRIAKHIVPVLGAYPMRAIRQADVQAFIDTLATGGAAPSTVKQYMGIIRRAFNIAALTSIDEVPIFTGKNPATGLRLPSIHNVRDRYLTASEVKKLLVAASELRSPDLHDCIVLSLNTGLRLGELMRLEWIDIDLSSGLLTVRDEAMRKPGGKVPLNDAALTVLKKRRAVGDASQMVFPPVMGDGLRHNIGVMFRRVADACELNKNVTDVRHRIVFHSLRHTFASWLALAGVDIYRIKTLMRHKSIAMTMRYAHLIPNATRDAVHNLTAPIEY